MDIKLQKKHNKKLDIHLKTIIKQFQVYNINNRLESTFPDPIIKRHGFNNKSSKTLAIVKEHIKLYI